MPNSEYLTQFTNCRLVRNHQLVQDDLWVRNGHIVNPEPIFFDEKALAHKKYDCKNSIIAPGYIDLQINGGYGVDFSFDSETVEQGINKVARELIKNGVTSFCPTIVTSPPEIYRKVIPRIPKTTNGAGILGLHLEGPFINIQKKGAHPDECIKNIDEGMKTVLEVYGSLDNVKILTLAPEKDSSGQTIRRLTNMGITVACGHSMGSLKDGEHAVRNGATLITHLFNAMLPFHHRDPGLVGLLASNKIPEGNTVYFGLISDGVHTHPTAMRIAYRTHPEGLILVTDAISALGLEEGVHHIGQLEMEVRNGKAFIAGTDTLCGSIAPMDECVRIFRKSTGTLVQISKTRQPKIYKKRVDPFSIPDEQFKLKYRFKKSTVRKIVDLVKDEVALDSRGCGTSTELQVLVALRCWGRGEFQDDAGDLHGLTQPTVSRICGRVARALACHAKEKIKMPTTLEEEACVMRSFKSICHFPGVIGAIDGTHIKIKKTGGDLAQYYINRKGYYSLNVQVVCDANLKIRDIVARWRGSTHDCRIFNESSIKQRFESGEFRGKILGDSGYKLTPYLFTPLHQPENEKELKYNVAHIATRNPVERCFGVWKQRFRCLLRGMTVSLSNAKVAIVALAVLHNIAIEENDLAPECSTVYAIEAATLHPAKCLNIEKSKGTLDFGTDADFIHLDDDLNVLSTWINGKMCSLY